MNRVSIPRIDPGVPVYRADLAMGEHSARHLRRVPRLYLTSWDLLELAPAAELALTELIANVVRHVPGRRCQTFIFRLPTGDGVRVEVGDNSTAVPLAIQRDELDDGGRWLILVNAVTDDWGVEIRWDGGGKTVWFECVDRPEGGDGRPGLQPATSDRTASVNGVQASDAHGPKARSVSATQATPAVGSIHRNVPDWPKWPKVAGEEEVPVQCGDLESRISKPRPQSFGLWWP